MAGPFASSFLLGNPDQSSLPLIDFKKHHRFVPAIGSIQIFAGRMYLHLSSRVWTLIIRRERRYRLHFVQSTFARVIRESRDRRIQLVDHISKTAIRPERYVSRARSSFEQCEW